MAEASKDTVIDVEVKPKGKAEAKRGGSGGLLFLLLLTWAAMAGGFLYLQKGAGQQQNKPQIMSSRPAKVDTSQLEIRLENLTKAQKALERELASRQRQMNPQGNHDVTGALDDVEARLDGMEHKLNSTARELRLAQSNAGASEELTQEITALQRRLMELEAQLKREQEKAQDAHSRPQMLAVLNLRERVAKAQPYEADLKALKALIRHEPELMMQLSQMESALLAGVPSIPTLLKQLEGLERELIIASGVPESGIVGRVEKSMKQLVTIRKLGEMPEGTTPEARLWRARAALEEGAVGNAVDEIRNLPEEAQRIAADWLIRAERVLTLEKQFTQLYEQVSRPSPPPQDISVPSERIPTRPMHPMMYREPEAQDMPTYTIQPRY